MNTPDRSDLPKLALIAGPTASGKSALAIAIAEKHRGTVINADSAQVYADLRVLSARPSIEDEARVPHRLFGHIDGADAYSAAHWAAEARAAIAEAHADHRLPILVGGTGMYLRTLLDGIAPVPEIDPHIRGELRALPVAETHAALAREDPEAAARLRPSDTTRVARALEVVRSTGRTLAAWQEERIGGIGHAMQVSAMILLPPRPWLVERCDRRFVQMLGDGAIEEVTALDARTDLVPDAPVLRAIGVREIQGLLDGTLDHQAALTKAQAATRQYAKRQYTWFRNQPPPDWHRTEATDSFIQLREFETKFSI